MSTTVLLPSNPPVFENVMRTFLVKNKLIVSPKLKKEFGLHILEKTHRIVGKTLGIISADNFLIMTRSNTECRISFTLCHYWNRRLIWNYCNFVTILILKIKNVNILE